MGIDWGDGVWVCIVLFEFMVDIVVVMLLVGVLWFGMVEIILLLLLWNVEVFGCLCMNVFEKVFFCFLECFWDEGVYVIW